MRRRPLSVLLTSSVLLLLGFGLPSGASAGETGPADGTSYTWAGASQDHDADNHSWTDARNWLPEGVPGDGDSVAIAPPDGSHCVAHVDAVPSGVTLQNFSLSVGGLCGASVNGGSLTVNGTFTWDTGVINTPMTLASSGTGVVSGAAEDNPRKVLEQNFTIDGTVDLVGALVQVTAPTLLTISPTGVLRSSGTGTFTPSACCVNPAHVVNDGTLDILDGALTVQAVQVDQNAHLDIASGAVLQAVNGPVTAANGATYTGSGRFQLWNGTKTTLTGTQNLGPGFHLELGNDGTGGDTLSGTTTLAGSGELDWTGGTIASNLTIAHGILLHAYGANPGNGHRVLSGLDSSSGSPVPATLVDHGVMTVDQQAGFVTSSTAHLALASDGSLSLAPGTQVTTTGCCVNPSAVVNTGGSLVVPATAGADPQSDADAAGPAVLDGVAYVATGGSVDVARGAELQLTGGPQSGMTNTTVKGAGRLTVSDPVALSGTETLAKGATLRLSTHGSLDGTATVAGPGTVEWQGGALSGDLTFANGGVTIVGPDQKTVANIAGGSQPSSVHVTAPVTVAAAKAKHHNLLNIGSSTLTLEGTTIIRANAELNGGTLVNTGTLTFDPGRKASVFTHVGLDVVNQGDVTLASGGLVSDGPYSQAAGTTTLAAGTTATFTFSSNPLSVDGGVLTGLGTVAGRLVNNAGVVDPGAGGTGPAGTLTVTGDYVQGAGGTLHLDLSSAGRDLLAVQGSASLAGTLVANNLQGYSPGTGDKRTVVQAGGGLTWNVGCATTTGTGSSGGHWQPKPSSSDLVLVWKRGAGQSC